MKLKSDVFPIFFTFRKLVENLFNAKIKYFQSDEAKEYDNQPLFNYFMEHGIYF